VTDSSDPEDRRTATRGDLREMRRDLLKAVDEIKSTQREMTKSLEDHFKEDSERNTDTQISLSGLNQRVESLTSSRKAMAQWVLGLVAMAVAAVVGFVVRSAIEVQVARPVQQLQPPTQTEARSP
jgi:Sec-independent protein translocase protein TatA